MREKMEFDGEVMLIPVLMPVKVFRSLNAEAQKHGLTMAHLVNDAIQSKLEELSGEDQRTGGQHGRL